MIYYDKVPFVWDEPRPRVQVSDRLEFRSLTHVGVAAFAAAVSRAMTGSFDRSDQKKVEDVGVRQAADEFVAAAATGDFDYKPEWWQLGFNHQGELVGFVQPVIYRGCAKDGLAEGTIYYIGVVPEQRGKRYGYDLLCKGTHILQEVGVWRIFCDTDVLNTPMLKAFQDAGYRQFSPPWKRSL